MTTALLHNYFFLTIIFNLIMMRPFYVFCTVFFIARVTSTSTITTRVHALCFVKDDAGINYLCLCFMCVVFLSIRVQHGRML